MAKKAGPSLDLEMVVLTCLLGRRLIASQGSGSNGRTPPSRHASSQQLAHQSTSTQTYTYTYTCIGWGPYPQPSFIALHRVESWVLSRQWPTPLARKLPT